MKGKMSSLSPVQGESDNKETPGSETRHYETNTNPNNRKHVSKRPFSPLELNADTSNLVIGSSICARIKPWLIPQETQLHAYRGSTTSDKLKVLQQYKTEGRTFNCIILQDGTKNEIDANVATSPSRRRCHEIDRTMSMSARAHVSFAFDPKVILGDPTVIKDCCVDGSS